MPRERIVVVEGLDEMDVPVREPAAELEFRGCGPERGAWEDAHANDNGAVAAEYEPPGRARWS